MVLSVFTRNHNANIFQEHCLAWRAIWPSKVLAFYCLVSFISLFLNSRGENYEFLKLWVSAEEFFHLPSNVTEGKKFLCEKFALLVSLKIPFDSKVHAIKWIFSGYKIRTFCSLQRKLKTKFKRWSWNFLIFSVLKTTTRDFRILISWFTIFLCNEFLLHRLSCFRSTFALLFVCFLSIVQKLKLRKTQEYSSLKI